MMKQVLFFLFVFLSSYEAMAQTTTFTVNNADGMPLQYEVVDAVNNEVNVRKRGAIPSGYTLGTVINIPATVEYGGTTYRIVGLSSSAFFSDTELTEVNLPEGLRSIGSYAFFESTITKVSIPTTLTTLSEFAFLFMAHFSPHGSLDTFDLSQTSIVDFPGGSLKIGGFGTSAFRRYILPATMQSISETVIGYSGDLTPETIVLKGSVPPTILPNTGGVTPTYNPFPTTQTFYVPVDATKVYEDNTQWTKYTGKYREELTIGANGYTSYYLENENFLVPAGCTAYIVKSVTSTTSSYGNAVVQAFSAGSIIPKQTGFILEGTPNATIAYQANVTGTEVDVTGNLLVGTATEQEFSGAGYKYYLFGKGSRGQGFYHQGTRDGESIKLQAHKAGLRLPTSGFAPAKDFVFDFEEAKRNATTGIVTAVTVDAGKADEAVYDLQGRRVTNPSRGVYIVNGKKVVK